MTIWGEETGGRKVVLEYELSLFLLFFLSLFLFLLLAQAGQRRFGSCPVQRKGESGRLEVGDEMEKLFRKILEVGNFGKVGWGEPVRTLKFIVFGHHLSTKRP